MTVVWLAHVILSLVQALHLKGKTGGGLASECPQQHVYIAHRQYAAVWTMQLCFDLQHAAIVVSHR